MLQCKRTSQWSKFCECLHSAAQSQYDFFLHNIFPSRNLKIPDISSLQWSECANVPKEECSFLDIYGLFNCGCVTFYVQGLERKFPRFVCVTHLGKVATCSMSMKKSRLQKIFNFLRLHSASSSCQMATDHSLKVNPKCPYWSWYWQFSKF